MPTYMENWSKDMLNKVKKQYANGNNSTNNSTDPNSTDSNTNGDGADATSSTAPTSGAMGTAGNVQSQNDPKKNKKLSELKMSEPLRELLTFDFVLPGIYPGIKTNQFLWVPVTDSFYDDMYCDVMDEIGPSKFNRYSAFEKGKFYIGKKKWEYDIENGVKTSFSVNPIPSMYSEYMKMQLEAERALDQAVIDASGGMGVADGGALGGTAVEIGNALAEKYGFCSSIVCPDPGGGESYEEMKKSGSGSCFAWSDALYTELNKAGIPTRIIQYNSGMASNHRSVQIQENGQWVDYPYDQIKRESVRKYAQATSSKGGCYVFKEPNGTGG